MAAGVIARLWTKSVGDAAALLAGGLGALVIWLYRTRWRARDDAIAAADFGGED